MATHLIDGEFQSDKYRTCPRGEVPLSCKDPMAQDLLWRYAERRHREDHEFASDLKAALKLKGYAHRHKAAPKDRRAQVAAQYLAVAGLCDILADVHRDVVQLFQTPSPHASDVIVELCGARSAAFMGKLGDMLNAMGAADCADVWMNPIFRVAQQTWPTPTGGGGGQQPGGDNG